MRAMKEFLLLISSILAVVGLIIWQFKILKKHHPNAEWLAGLLEMLNKEQETLEDHANG
jgi:hypothetical protein